MGISIRLDTTVFGGCAQPLFLFMTGPASSLRGPMGIHISYSTLSRKNYHT